MATQEIGIPIDLTHGEYHNTEIKNGKLQLKELAISDSGKIIYAASGYWISSVIEMKDKIAAFERVTKDLTYINSASYKIYTASSFDGYAWSEWTEINYSTGHIATVKNNFARLKIELLSVKTDELFTIDDFEIDEKYNNEFVNHSRGVLELKTSYEKRMLSTPSSETGKIFRATVNKTSLLRIDNLEIEEG